MNCDFDIIAKAIEFATKTHQGIPRKGTQPPYILHPLEAAAIVSSMTIEVSQKNLIH